MPEDPPSPYRQELIDAERVILQRALSAADGDVAKAAEVLGIPSRSLYHRLRACGIRAAWFRPAPDTPEPT